ncbi:MAG: HNH endonuclease [Nitrosomonadales bacterium]|nr:HNH endonuclease [Nitrosomonadales bacterium]
MRNTRIEQLLNGEIQGTYFSKEYVIVDTVKMTYSQYQSPEVQKEIAKKRSKAYAKERTAKLESARKKGTHTKKQWIALLEEFEYRCLRCGNVPDEGLTKDHIQMISRDGSDAIENIQPLCRQCNSAQEQFNWVVWRRANGFGLGTNCFSWMRRIGK